MIRKESNVDVSIRTNVADTKTDLPPRLQPTLWLTPSLAKAPFISLEVRSLSAPSHSTIQMQRPQPRFSAVLLKAII